MPPLARRWTGAILSWGGWNADVGSGDGRGGVQLRYGQAAVLCACLFPISIRLHLRCRPGRPAFLGRGAYGARGGGDNNDSHELAVDYEVSGSLPRIPKPQSAEPVPPAFSRIRPSDRDESTSARNRPEAIHMSAKSLYRSSNPALRCGSERITG